MNKDTMFGSAIQLIKDINHISLLGDRGACIMIEYMTEEWIKIWLLKDLNQHDDKS